MLFTLFIRICLFLIGHIFPIENKRNYFNKTVSFNKENLSLSKMSKCNKKSILILRSVCYQRLWGRVPFGGMKTMRGVVFRQSTLNISKIGYTPTWEWTLHSLSLTPGSLIVHNLLYPLDALDCSVKPKKEANIFIYLNIYSR